MGLGWAYLRAGSDCDVVDWGAGGWGGRGGRALRRGRGREVEGGDLERRTGFDGGDAAAYRCVVVSEGFGELDCACGGQAGQSGKEERVEMHFFFSKNGWLVGGGYGE